MNRKEAKYVRRTRRKAGVRKRVSGGPDRPRMSVRRSLNHMYVQIIDDLAGRTIVSASTRDASLSLGSESGNAKGAAALGKSIAQRAKEKGVQKVVFDRGWYRYHGRIKALADAARSEGLEF